MIFRVLIEAVATLLSAVFGVFPDMPVPYFSEVDTSTARGIGQGMGAVDPFVPVKEMVLIGLFVFGGVYPMLGLWAVANWIYRHIPQVLGTGPGSG